MASDWAEERETLLAIYDNAIEATDQGFYMRLRPDVDHEQQCFVQLDLTFQVPTNYPEAKPTVLLASPRGLNHEQFTRLVQDIEELVADASEAQEACAIDVIQSLKTGLEEMNQPPSTCVICLDNLRSDNLYKTRCFHCFHLSCLIRYLYYRHHNMEADMTAEDHARLRAQYATDEEIAAARLKEERAKPSPCPICREAMPADRTLKKAAEEIAGMPPTLDPAGSASPVKDLPMPLSPQQRKEQEKRQALFQRQLAKGGIICAS
ncbi:uncharacterized protein MONBRDRAFT_34086 [Monosiga brevicollis MX1]|uniref:RWD domain-containing protein n=1 Tax=Monosiga brevicollis TaxID=81824 RepID=A9V9D5_MONBE|nr:uncharacterized protein MONBRDRAFT_34086 [Monosiga brevicollis MX1]EDQ85842.1 predicted protein [Monosiga brevicollis MX1]|eukprot:XP_001749321.1 hypothetical protein [Monosiga brevicollis MX1]